MSLAVPSVSAARPASGACQWLQGPLLGKPGAFTVVALDREASRTGEESFWDGGE